MSDPATFEFMLQPGGEIETDGDTFVIQGERARLVGRVLAPASVAMEVSPGIGERINVKEPLTLRIAAPGQAREMDFVVVLAPLAEGEKEPAVSLSSDGRGVVLGDTTAAFE